MDSSDLLTLVLVVLGILVLLGLATIGFVMWRYRIPPRGLIAMIGGLVYLASPVDVLPEVMLGPLGLVDDAGVVTAVAVFVYKVMTVKGQLEKRRHEGSTKARSRWIDLRMRRASTIRSCQPRWRGRGHEAIGARCRSIRRRSRSVYPPQTPHSMPLTSASFKHSRRTGQSVQNRRIIFCSASSPKNSSPMPAHFAERVHRCRGC